MHEFFPSEYMALTSNKTLISLLQNTKTFLYINIKYFTFTYQICVCLNYETKANKGINGLAIQQSNFVLLNSSVELCAFFYKCTLPIYMHF